MSNRTNAYRYLAPTPPSYGGGGGGNGLLNLLTGNSPKQLQGQQQQHETAIQQMIQQHEKDMADIEANHSKELLAKQEELADKLRNNSTVVKAAEQAGVSVDEYVKNIMPQASSNALQLGKLQNKSQDTPEFLNSLNRGNVASNLGPEVNNAKTLAEASKTGLGEVKNVPIVKGVNDNAMDITGATAQQGVIPFGGFPDPKTGQMIGQQALPVNSMQPGRITRPVDPAIRAQAMNGGNQPSGNQPDFQYPDFMKMFGNGSQPVMTNPNLPNLSPTPNMPQGMPQDKATFLSTLLEVLNRGSNQAPPANSINPLLGGFRNFGY